MSWWGGCGRGMEKSAGRHRGRWDKSEITNLVHVCFPFLLNVPSVSLVFQEYNSATESTAKARVCEATSLFNVSTKSCLCHFVLLIPICHATPNIISKNSLPRPSQCKITKLRNSIASHTRKTATGVWGTCQLGSCEGGEPQKRQHRKKSCESNFLYCAKMVNEK